MRPITFMLEARSRNIMGLLLLISCLYSEDIQGVGLKLPLIPGMMSYQYYNILDEGVEETFSNQLTAYNVDGYFIVSKTLEDGTAKRTGYTPESRLVNTIVSGKYIFQKFKSRDSGKVEICLMYSDDSMIMRLKTQSESKLLVYGMAGNNRDKNQLFDIQLAIAVVLCRNFRGDLMNMMDDFSVEAANKFQEKFKKQMPALMTEAVKYIKSKQ